MIELEVKLGPKTGLDTVQNEKHVEVEVASPDDSNQAPLVRVTVTMNMTTSMTMNNEHEHEYGHDNVLTSQLLHHNCCLLHHQ